MDLEKVKSHWVKYEEEFSNSEYMDIDEHTSTAFLVPKLIRKIERLHDTLNEINTVACDGLNDEVDIALETIRNMTDEYKSEELI